MPWRRSAATPARCWTLHQLWCGVGARNEASLCLFRRTGFVACGTRRDWHRTPEGYEDEVMLQRIL